MKSKHKLEGPSCSNERERERERERESLKGENYDLTRDRVALINFKSHAPRPFECDYLPKFIQVFNSFF